MFEILIALLVAHQPPDLTADARYPLVRIADAAEFGVSRDTADHMIAVAGQHMRHYGPYLQTYYFPGEYHRWNCEAKKHQNAWVKLWTALAEDPFEWLEESDENGHLWKLRRLDELREAIGDEAYSARRMPEPTPSWMFVK